VGANQLCTGPERSSPGLAGPLHHLPGGDPIPAQDKETEALGRLYQAWSPNKQPECMLRLPAGHRHLESL
jgi:hypothetical protein